MTMQHPQRKRLRLDRHDYGAGDTYFITICSYNRQRIFGEIVYVSLVPSSIGNIVLHQITQIEIVRPDVVVDEFVLMPNHLHMLLSIMHTDIASSSTLPAIVRGLKGAVTSQAQNTGLLTAANTLWQRSYHDHIVRSRDEYERIAKYIYHNPETWEQDALYMTSPTRLIISSY